MIKFDKFGEIKTPSTVKIILLITIHFYYCYYSFLPLLLFILLFTVHIYRYYYFYCLFLLLLLFIRHYLYVTTHTCSTVVKITVAWCGEVWSVSNVARYSCGRIGPRSLGLVYQLMECRSQAGFSPPWGFLCSLTMIVPCEKWVFNFLMCLNYCLLFSKSF